MPNVLTKALPAKSCYCYAVKRNSRVYNGLISDNKLLENYYHDTTITKIIKCHGSNVPGPFESRRRIGKRKMAYSLEPVPHYQSKTWAWWTSFQEYDPTDWKWEPPRSVCINRRIRADSPQHIPLKRLHSMFTNITKRFAVLTRSSRIGISDNQLLQERLMHLRVAIQNGSKDIIIEVCQNLNLHFRRKIRQGKICQSNTIQILEEVSVELRKVSELDFATSLCYFFYHAAWQGLKSSRLEERIKKMPETVAILRGLSNLPSKFEVQELVGSITQGIPSTVIKTVPIEIYQVLFISWTSSWYEGVRHVSPLYHQTKYSYETYRRHLLAAEQNIKKNEQLISKIRNEIVLGAKEEYLDSSLDKLKLEIFSSLKIVECAENIVTPEKLSISMLSKTLDTLPQISIKDILQECSKNLCDIFSQNQNEKFLKAKKYWLSSISQLSKLSCDEFLSLWKYMDDNSQPSSESLYPEILINIWGVQGKIKNKESFRNIIEIMTLDSEQVYEPLISLVSAIYKYDNLNCHFEKMGFIFHTLHVLGRFNTIGITICRMSKLSLRLPTEIFEFIVEILVDHNPKMAWHLVMLSYTMKPGRKYRSQSFPRGDHRSLRFSRCLKFVTWMIRSSDFAPKYIWKILKIPIHKNYIRPFKNQPSNKPMNWHEINFLRAMAIAFAYSERLRARVAFRNVMQCWHELCHHRTPPEKTLIRALIHSGLARCVEKGVWIPLRRLAWLCHLVEMVEGPEIAKQVEISARNWNMLISRRKAWLQRQLNPLDVGPID